MRVFFLFLLGSILLTCESVPNATATATQTPVIQSKDSTLIKRIERNNRAPISMDEIRSPSNASSLPGLSASAVQEKIKSPFSVYKEGSYTVISPDGLKMRGGPSLDADVVGVIPYLDVVSIVDLHNVVRDTLNKNDKYLGYSHAHFDKNITGDWVKINYGGIESFVFSAYLIKGAPDWGGYPWKNKNYAINSISKDCILELHENPDMNWYGIFKKEDGFILEPISISYRVLYEPNMLSNCIVNAMPNKGLGLCFGTMKKMKTQRIEMRGSGIKLEYDSLFQPQHARIRDACAEKLKALNFEVYKTKNADGFGLILSDGDRQQYLEKDLNLEHCWPATIYLVGDIDQDGQMDYYINYISHDSIGDAVLYLSSEARSGEIVRPVAINQVGYCC